MNIISEIYRNRRLLISLTKNEFTQRYLGNNLGIAWAFIQPLMTIMILWFVFQVGFKSQPVGDVPFVLWLIAGMVPWFFFSDGLSSGVGSVSGNIFLVKKIVFKVELLPVVSIITVLVIHCAFVVMLLAVFFLHGYDINIYWLQIPYYMLMASILLLGLSFFTSSIVLFFKDLGQIVAIVVQFGFWVTPIFWSLSMIPESYVFIVKLNPLLYIIDGYRDSLIYHVWFWEDMSMTLYYWVVTSLLFILGNVVFAKLRPHFADVA